ncbi:MAG: precorrin-2 dehydrogenase [Actinomycetota bacterium]|nr:precorrin-2 dehydrogenase [Actinomycetota bacterium]
MNAYPVNLDVAGRRCVVVGGGRVAGRKVEGLVACGAVVKVVAPSISDEVKAAATSWDERAYATGDLDGARLVITATDDPAVNQRVFDDAEAAGVWVNSADDPERCSFTLPAVARQGPITVAVGTGGASPALASWLRDRLAADLGPEYATLAGLLAEARAIVKAAGRSTEGLAWHKALDSDMLVLIRGGRISEARERLKTCLSSS